MPRAKHRALNGEGSICRCTKHGTEYWRLRLNGSEKYLPVSEEKSEKKAYAILMERINTKQAADEGDKITLNNFLEDFIALYANDIDPATKREYVSAVRAHLAATKGEKLLEEITTKDIQSRLNFIQTEEYGKTTRRKTPASPKTVKNIATAISKVFETAKNLQPPLINNNPCDGLSLPQITRNYDEEGWSIDRIQDVIALLAAKKVKYLYFYLFIIFTGLRRSEVEGLRWSRVDLATGVIIIDSQRSRKQLKDESVFKEKTKTHAGRRRFVLNDMAREVLCLQANDQLEKRSNAGNAWIDNDLVFCRDDGSPLTNSVYEQMKKALADYDKSITIHGLRHAFADLCVDAELPEKALQTILGHASITTTHNIYTHRNSTLDRLASEKSTAYIRQNFGNLEDLLSPEMNKLNNLGTEIGDKGIK